MKILSALCLLLLSACASQIPYVHRVSAGIGQRDTGDDFEPAEKQLAIGIEYDTRQQGKQVGLEVGLTGSRDDATVMGIDFDVTTTEAYVGARYTWGVASRAMPYVSGGVTWMRAELEASGNSVSDDDFAPYAGAGFDYNLGEHWFIGVGLRYVFGANGDFLGFEGDADGPIALFKIGYGGSSTGPQPTR